MNSPFDAVRYELLRPHELRAIIAVRPVAYLPLGTFEWHGEHLPVGLDALTAHGVCLGVAAVDGGVVLPPLYYGTGGGHSAYPWTVMMPNPTEISALLSHTLMRLQDFGVQLTVLFSGHFADIQLDMIARLATEWNGGNSAMSVNALGVNQFEGLPLAPDHAAIFETTLLGELFPDRVAIDLLPPLIGELDTQPWSDARHQSGHPLHGIFGPDPRTYDPLRGPKLLEGMVERMTAIVRRLLPHDISTARENAPEARK